MNLSVMRLIARIFRSDQQSDGGGRSAAAHPAACLRLVGAFACILLCALSKNAWFTVSVLAVELLRTALKRPESVAHILRPVLVAVLFAAIFTLPAVFMGSPGSLGTVTMKVAESVLVLSVMNEEVSWKETTGALADFHLPDIIVLTLDSTIRFLVILGCFSEKMLEAVSLRRVGTKNWKNAGTGGILGTTFLKSQQLSQETSEAMICRGFTGDFRRSGYYVPEKRKGQAAVNLVYCLLFPVLIAAFLYTQSLV